MGPIARSTSSALHATADSRGIRLAARRAMKLLMGFAALDDERIPA
jgi:hypothetical protein